MAYAQVKGVAAHMKQARAWTSVEVTERLAAQPPPPPCVSRVPLRETRRWRGGRVASMAWGDAAGQGQGETRRWRGARVASMAWGDAAGQGSWTDASTAL